MPGEMLRYSGSLEGAYDLVDELRSRGIDVKWNPPPEERTNADQGVVVSLHLQGDENRLREAVDQLRASSDGTSF